VTEAKQARLKLELAAKVFGHAVEGITITDVRGTILDVNATFSRITGYSREEAVGQNPRILKSGRQDTAFYQTLWQTLLREGHWRGEIWNRRKNGEVYPELLTVSAVRDDKGVTQQYVALFSDITERKAMEEELQQLAFVDTLTHLPNRRLLNDRLAQALLTNKRSARFGALMFLDLDNFKPLNDNHGHAAGDLLLIEVAKRLSRCVREADTVARVGGDEFVVMLSELGPNASSASEEAATVAEKIRRNLSEPYLMSVVLHDMPDKVVEHHCSASIGVTMMPPDTSNLANLLMRADAAMYRAKELGRNRIEFAQV
jgi:diguanylate cyclase (GGDEF)-like protein/PAS domain S-box-containing protein